MSQLIEITASSGLTGLVGRLFANGSDTVAATASSVTEATNRKSVYVTTFTGVTVGTYQLLLLDADSLPVASRTVRITATSGTFTEIDEDEAVLDVLGAPARASIAADIAAIEGGGGLTGPYARTITITDTDTDDPIEGALVRLYRTGESETKTTDVDGETEPFATGAYTYSYAVTAAGYAGAAGTIAISGDGATTIELTASSVTVPDDPALATLSVKCLDEAGAAEPGAKVYVRLVGIPSGSTGLAFDGISQDATAGSDGIASLTIVKLAKYQIRRGDSKTWKDFTATSASSQVITSFVGVDPA